MLSTKKILCSFADVPDTWVFEHFLDLQVKLDGGDIKIKSIFNDNDTNPSMCLYVGNNNKYLYHDFSTGRHGDCIDLVSSIESCSLFDAYNKIVSEYTNYLSLGNNYQRKELKIQEKFKLVDYKVRNWNKDDADYWLSYYIGSSMLSKYNVMPLECYTMGKPIGNTRQQFEVKSSHIYGYFRSNGDIYKIYKPKCKEDKFTSVLTYIQGVDQLVPNKNDYLIIGSSLKDIMSLLQLGIGNIQVIAAPSENSLLKEGYVEFLKSNYKGLITILDNDTAGIKAMNDYYQKYNIPFVNLDMEKDIADTVKKYGPKQTKKVLFPLLKKICTNT